MKVKPLLPGLIWCMIILVVMLLPGDRLPSGGFLEGVHFDKFVHFFLYCILVILWSYGLQQQYPAPRLRYQNECIALLTGVVYGIITEGAQALLSIHRTFETADLLANTAGSLAGLACWLALFRLKTS